MQVALACSCGQRFAAAEHLFGRQVACPSCGGLLAVPHPALTSSQITAACRCGQRFAAEPYLAGRQVPCPCCGSTLCIPTGTGADALEPVAKRTALSPPASPAAVAPRSLASLQRSQARPSKPVNWKLPAAIAAAVLVSLVSCGAGAVVLRNWLASSEATSSNVSPDTAIGGVVHQAPDAQSHNSLQAELAKIRADSERFLANREAEIKQLEADFENRGQRIVQNTNGIISSGGGPSLGKSSKTPKRGPTELITAEDFSWDRYDPPHRRYQVLMPARVQETRSTTPAGTIEIYFATSKSEHFGCSVSYSDVPTLPAGKTEADVLETYLEDLVMRVQDRLDVKRAIEIGPRPGWELEFQSRVQASVRTKHRIFLLGGDVFDLYCVYDGLVELACVDKFFDSFEVQPGFAGLTMPLRFDKTPSTPAERSQAQCARSLGSPDRIIYRSQPGSAKSDRPLYREDSAGSETR